MSSSMVNVMPCSRKSLGPVLILALLAFSQSVETHAQTPSRPRVGVALGGGSARGLAHVGVLRWLEDHRIPVDLITGTSMGGLVGGSYATGPGASIGS